MSTDAVAIARTFMENAIGKADMAAFDACCSPDIVVRTGLSPAGPITGLAAYKEAFGGFAQAFPVLDFVVHELWPSPDGDKVVARFTATAVFLHDYFGVPATRQVVAMEEVHILSFAGGRIVGNIVSGTNFPFEYLMFPVLKDPVLGPLQPASAEQLARVDGSAL